MSGKLPEALIGVHTKGLMIVLSDLMGSLLMHLLWQSALWLVVLGSAFLSVVHSHTHMHMHTHTCTHTHTFSL